MGSCVSKKAARAGAKGEVAAPLPVVEKENAHAPPPVLEVEVEVEEEEVKEVVLSETPVPRPPRLLPPLPEPAKRRQEQAEAVDDEAAAVSASETCSASDSAASAAAKGAKAAGGEREVEKRALLDAPEKGKPTARSTTPEESRKPKGAGAGAVNGHGRARSPSPSSAHRRQQSGGQGHQHHPPRREHPAVVSGIGCRSGRFSPSAARRAAESAVRRTHSAREADMALPSSKRSLSLSAFAINGNGNGHGAGVALSGRDPGERSGQRSVSPATRRRAPASPSHSAVHRPASPVRKAAAKEHGGTPERGSRPARVIRDGGPDAERAALLGGGVGAEQRTKLAEGEEGALGHQNPSVAMECFIFL
ncbi:hypothetical protein Zm00014a_042737 [Zea mays]|uniref:Uncharacterized protein n=1 Tax=Zea mays TaxID=4577 RepID=A0A3L6EK77_MAIZE|nr:hypothetical protein Zm00014a_042737 [Zea mays]